MLPLAEADAGNADGPWSVYFCTIHQVLSADGEPDFSEDSYGFRRGRGARGAVEARREHVEAGQRSVVDLDLEKFFETVNHAVLRARLARKIEEKRFVE